jgi:hypothetical protein
MKNSLQLKKINVDLTTLFDRMIGLFVLLLLIPTNTLHELEDQFYQIFSKKTKQAVFQLHQPEIQNFNQNYQLESNVSPIQHTAQERDGKKA